MTTPEDTELRKAIINELDRHYSDRPAGGYWFLYEDAIPDLIRIITLHTRKAERLAQNKMQVDSALHVEEYHYHRLNDVKISNASVEELITDSKRRIAHLTNPTEAGEL